MTFIQEQLHSQRAFSWIIIKLIESIGSAFFKPQKVLMVFAT